MWGVVFVAGREVRAVEKLEQLGIKSFCPEEWHFYLDKRTKAQKYRVRPLFPGYLFVQMFGAADYNKVHESDEIVRVLGSMEGGTFRPSVITEAWLNELREAGPVKVGIRRAHKRGDRVRILVGKLTEQIVQVERIDRSGRVLVGIEMLGKKHLVRFEESECVDA